MRYDHASNEQDDLYSKLGKWTTYQYHSDDGSSNSVKILPLFVIHQVHVVMNESGNVLDNYHFCSISIIRNIMVPLIWIYT